MVLDQEISSMVLNTMSVVRDSGCQVLALLTARAVRLARLMKTITVCLSAP